MKKIEFKKENMTLVAVILTAMKKVTMKRMMKRVIPIEKENIKSMLTQLIKAIRN